MNLADYLAAVNESQTAFAERASKYRPEQPIAQRTISRITLGESCGADIALAIIRASHDRPTPGGGTIALEDLVVSKDSNGATA